jgi:hypothetical protein
MNMKKHEKKWTIRLTEGPTWIVEHPEEWLDKNRHSYEDEFPICECSSHENALKIRSALNALDKSLKGNKRI